MHSVFSFCFFFFFKQKTAYEMAQCDWSSDVCSSDLRSCLRISGYSLPPLTNTTDSLTFTTSQQLEIRAGTVSQAAACPLMGERARGESAKPYENPTGHCWKVRDPYWNTEFNHTIRCQDGSGKRP